MLNWINIAEKLPEEDKPIFLIKNESDNINIADVGYLLTSDDGKEKGFFVDNNMKVLKLHARTSWMYVEEKTFFVPDKPDKELEPTVLEFLSKLRFFDEKFRRLSYWMIKSGEGIYPLDFYVSGIVSRSLSLIYGFETLIISHNYIAAAHLVRPHLDNFMRLNAAWLTENPHEFANKVWKGEQVRKLKDRNGKLMSDRYLKDKATERYPWMESVYNETSGFIHFSNKHIKNAMSLTNEEDVIETFLGKTDNNVSNKSKLEAIMCMVETCNAIADSMFGWITTKRIKG
jgi:hypothetical protein